MVHPARLAFVLAVAALLSAPRARAQTTSWSATLPCAAGGTCGTPSAPTNDLTFNPTTPSLYLSQGSTLYAYDHLLNWRWTSTLTTATQNFPSPVPLRDGTRAIFVGGSDGFLYKLNAANGAVSWSRDLKRATCSADTIIATPWVQLKNFSNAGFAQTDDVVYAITRYNCSTSSQNRVFAFHASDGSPAWTSSGTPFQFNDGGLGGTFVMDYGSEGCALDYTRNLLYCGTNQTQPNQPSLWAINSSNGSLAWSQKVGSVRTRPSLKPNTNLLYVPSFGGTLYARDANNLGAAIYSVTVTTTAFLNKNIWVEFRGSFANMILVGDSAGNIYGLQHTPQNGGTPASASKVWTATPAAFGGNTPNSMAVISPDVAMGYVGTINGAILQFDLIHGVLNAGVVVGTTAVYDPAVDTDGSTSSDLSRISAAYAGGIARYVIPMPVGSGHVAPPCVPDPCTLVTCGAMPDGGTIDGGGQVCGNCYPVGELANGTACAKGTTPDCAVVGTGICHAGVCIYQPSVDGTSCPAPSELPCHVGLCVAGACATDLAAPNGTACNDSKSCTCDPAYATGSPATCPAVCSNPSGCDSCQGGLCWGAVATTCTCSKPGDHACAPGSTCCGSSVCTNLLADPSNCGGCGTVCGSNKVCTSGQCVRGNGCSSTSPSAAALNSYASSLTGTLAITYDQSQCWAWLATTAGFQLVTSGGVAGLSTVGTIDGLGVSPDGFNVVGVLDPTSGIPEIVTKGFFVGSVVVLDNTGAPTTSTVPFTDTRLDDDMVGSALDTRTYTSAGTMTEFHAQHNASGFVGTRALTCTLSGGCTVNTAGSTAPYNTPGGDRVTALSFGVRPSGGATLWVAHTNTVTAVTVDTVTTPVDVNLATAFTPNTANGEAAITGGILSVAADPSYGDCYVEARDANGKLEDLVISAYDLSVMNLAEWNKAYGGGAVSSTFTGEGKLTMDWVGHLIRLIPSYSGAPAFSDLPLVP